MIVNYKNLIYALANCGIMTKNIARDLFKIHHKTLNNLVNNNTLIVKGNLVLYGKATTIYVLTEETKNSIRKLGKSPYKTNTSQLEHDYLLLRAYSTLPASIQNTWLNETELKEMYPNSATTDGLFIVHNKKIGIEVITPNYTPEIVNRKLNFGEIYCDKLITLNTNDIRK